AFVAKLNPAGSTLVYSTYLGGGGSDDGIGIAVDAAGAAYVTGDTTSTNFPTASPLQAANGGGADAFVAKLSFASPTLVTQATPNATQGQAISDTATLAGGANPTGTITFRV